ncbi:hypothetical protein CEE39_04655 [bacterium (candidate division B38) B3_B38]|nr:MAG: hypothetical protein CEE39_04655 [bacterium (candidate division B38) B3_B38]
MGDKIKELSSLIDELERILNDSLAKKKILIDSNLEEFVKQKREENRLKFESAKTETDKMKADLNSIRAPILELEQEKARFTEEINRHIELANQYQSKIEELTRLRKEELEKAMEKDLQMREYERSIIEKVNELKNELSDRYRHLREAILSKKEEAKVEEAKVSPEKEQWEPSPSPEEGATEENLLESYKKKDESLGDGTINFIYFQLKDRVIMDGESLLKGINSGVEQMKELYSKLEETGSSKDKYFMKQRIINIQAMLRKIVIKSVSMCKFKYGSLPKYTNDVLNLSLLEEMMEKLNTQNWTKKSDFEEFASFFGEISRAFQSKITPKEPYLKAVLEEITY